MPANEGLPTHLKLTSVVYAKIAQLATKLPSDDSSVKFSDRPF